MSHLQRELGSLGGSLQGLLTVVGLQHHCVPLLGVAVRRHIVREALWMIGSVSIRSEHLNKVIEVRTQVMMFYFIPAVWETEEIQKTGTGNAETSKGNLKQPFISPYDKVIKQHYTVCCFVVPEQGFGPAEGH